MNISRNNSFNINKNYDNNAFECEYKDAQLIKDGNLCVAFFLVYVFCNGNGTEFLVSS